MTERAKTRPTTGSGKVSASAGKDDAQFRVEAWMSLPVLTVKPQDTVAHARALLEEHRVNQLPVVFNGKLVGIVTDRDLRDAPRAAEVSAKVARAEVSPEQFDPEKLAVESVMTSNVLVVAPSDSIEQAVSLMRRERIGAVPVVADRRLAGILTRSDVLDAFIALVHRLR